MSFVIAHETENVESNKEVEIAFQAITSGGDKPYVTKEELFQVFTCVGVVQMCGCEWVHMCGCKWVGVVWCTCVGVHVCA